MILRFIFPFGMYVLISLSVTAQPSQEIPVQFNVKNTHQTIRNFSASDAWAVQFVGNWPQAKKDSIADWLFSMDTLPNGNPKGIGLSMWRFNIGAGSAEQGRESGIRDEWRRAPAFTNDTSAKLAGQTWFLQAAKQRGVPQFLGFFNSPPVTLTTNGKAFATAGKCSIDSTKYNAFAEYAVAVIHDIKQITGINVNYISPLNEPQWDWGGGQEGCPYTNTEISAVIKQFNQVFLQHNVVAKLLVSESGHLKYLLNDADKPGRGNQVKNFFKPASPQYIDNLPCLANVIASHSYFTTSPYTQAVALRHQIRNRINSFPHLEYWQSEYCILGDNVGEINGNKKDLGMTAALYVAKVIHTDLVEANAAAWQWWTAISAYDYKDGLVYIDKNKNDGHFSDSKMLWALGNYSRFIRPGMQRIDVNFSAVKELFISAWFNSAKKEIVSVLINNADTEQTISFANSNQKYNIVNAYITNETESLGKHTITTNKLVLMPKSVVTVIMKQN